MKLHRYAAALAFAPLVVSCSGGGSDPAQAQGQGQASNRIVVDTPAPGSNVDAPRALVQGRVVGASGLVVRINDQLACSAGDTFFLNAFALPAAQHTLQIEATLDDGSTGTASSPLTLSDGRGGLFVTTTGCGGVAPFEANLSLSLSNLSAADIAKVEGFIDDEPARSYTTTELTEGISHVFDSAGLHRARFVVTLKDGSTRGDAAYVNVEDAKTVELALQRVYAGLKTALAQRDAGGALEWLSTGAKGRYQKAFTQEAGRLAQEVKNWSDLQPVEIGDNIAFATMIATQDGVAGDSPVTFVRDDNGQWKIDTL
jgi:hypothetical protein